MLSLAPRVFHCISSFLHMSFEHLFVPADESSSSSAPPLVPYIFCFLCSLTTWEVVCSADFPLILLVLWSSCAPRLHVTVSVSVLCWGNSCCGAGTLISYTSTSKQYSHLTMVLEYLFFLSWSWIQHQTSVTTSWTHTLLYCVCFARSDSLHAVGEIWGEN